jgi:L-iditol 2-dehydrogenase
MACEDCLKGDYSLCKHYSFIGSREFGSFAEYVLVPDMNVVKFADEVTFEMGALFEPATVALHGFKRFDVKGGKNIAILGGGTIGMMTAQWARIFGAKTVTVFDVVDQRLELAKRLGCQFAINTVKDDIMAKVNEITNSRGYDYVFETAGIPATVLLAYRIVCNKGSVCFIGTPSREITFSIPEWENILRKEFTATGSWTSYSAPFPGEEWSLVAHYFKTGDLKLDNSFIFRKIPLSKIADAFEMYKTAGFVKGKILIESEK